MQRPREHVDAPLAVRDAAGAGYALSLDEPVRAPTPPDGRENVTTVRALTKDCAAPTDPCWIHRPFELVVVGEPGAVEPPAGRSRVAEALAGVVLVGALGGIGYCAYECPDPWNKAVPIAGGVALLTTLTVGAVLWARSMGTVR